MFIEYPRGSVFLAVDANKPTDSVQSGTRPVLIISNNMNNIHSSVVTVIPITGQVKRDLPTHVVIPAITREGVNTILCEQIKTVPKSCLKRYYGMLSTETMFDVEKAIAIHLNILPLPTVVQTEDKPKEQPKEQPKAVTNRGYSEEYKKQYLKDAKRLNNVQLAKKYGITPKAAWHRTKVWTAQFK